MATRTRRVLCSLCLQSFDADEVELVGCGFLCESCQVGVADRKQSGALVVPEARRPVGEGMAARYASKSFGSQGFWRRLYREMQDCCDGRLWWTRAPLWLYFAYVLIRHWFQPGDYRSLFDSLNLGVHELGHFIFRPFGEFMTAAGGTITQCLAPIISVLMFYRQKDFFGIAVCFCWLATNLWGVAIYAGDARALVLQLVAPGHGVLPRGEGHDWNYMLGRLGMLQWDTTIEWLFRLLATSVMLVGLALGAWILWRMFSRRSAPCLASEL